MKLVKWIFQGLEIGMIEDEAGDLWCTNQALLSALKLSKKHITEIQERNRYEFSLVTKSPLQGLKDFAKEHKEELGIQRVRKLWSEEEVITFAYHARSKTAIHFRVELVQFIKFHRQATTISLEQYRALTRDVEMLKDAIPHFDAAASNAGRTLASFRGTKEVRSYLH